jgi:hypothetical protein
MLRITALLLLAAAYAVPCAAQAAEDAYWTPRRKIETVAATGFHFADVAQTCHHLSHGAHEMSPITPNNCAGAAVAITGESAAVQYLSYRLARRFVWWRPLDRVLPYFEISLSVNAIRCSNTRAGCNSMGF